MVNVTPNQARSRGLPTMPPGQPIAAYRTYEQAQRAVDYLSDNRFPVQFVSIVGNDLKMVERVTGRLTYSRVALAGLLSGAYWGIFLGVLFSLFGGRSMGSTVPAMGALGAGFGLIFGLVSYAATGGRRDFTSTSQIVATEYAVWCAEDHIGVARQMLDHLPDDHRLPGGGSAAPAGGQVRPGPDPAQQQWPQPGSGHPQGPGQPGAGGPGPWQQGPGGPYPGQQAQGPGAFRPGQGGGQPGTGPSSWPSGPGGAQGPGQPGPWQAAPGQPQPGQQPYVQPGQPQPGGQQAGSHPVGQEPAQQAPVSGPTYSEMMERRRQERLAQERQDPGRDGQD